jgi:hypothetical protein
MEAFNEYALLFAVALPAGILAGLNLALWCAGERGTLLMPTADRRGWLLHPVPEPLGNAQSFAPEVAEALASTLVAGPPPQAANQDIEREAA